MPGEVITFDKNNLINTKYHEGASAFSADTNYIYFTRCGSDKVLETEYCKIFRSKRQSDNSWGPVQLVELYGEHDTFNVGQPVYHQMGIIYSSLLICREVMEGRIFISVKKNWECGVTL